MNFPKNRIFLHLLLLLLATTSTPLWADRDREHGHGHGKSRDKYHDDRRDDDHRHDSYSINVYFQDSHRNAVNDYYRRESHAGHCPPGLAKKGNGCMPPGQARKWQVGRALPRDLQRYPLPYDLLRRMPPPPRGHEYVRVAGDILLVAVGTSMVVDAIDDLMR